LMQDSEVGEILRHFHAHKKPTAFLCHGPIATIAAMPKAREFRAALIAGDTARASELARGWQYSGYKMTVFSITEEKVIEERILHAKLYFNMVDALRIAGGNVSTTAIDFGPNTALSVESWAVLCDALAVIPFASCLIEEPVTDAAMDLRQGQATAVGPRG